MVRRAAPGSKSKPTRRRASLRRLSIAGSLAVFGALAWWLGRADRGPGLAAEAEPASSVLRLVPRVVASFPHDPGASTQGLLWFEGRLFESTGLWGSSSLRRVEPASGRIEQQVDLDASLFGEGLARVGRELVQLTWRGGRALRWDLDSFSYRGEYRYEGEGWGLCFDERHLWRSDGSARLFRHSAADFAPVDWLQVSLEGRALERLNELECAEGWVYANVWQSDEIVRIDPASGRVVAVIDVSALLTAAERSGAGVANGIAYRPETQTFLLTGKNWPRVFEVVFVDRRST